MKLLASYVCLSISLTMLYGSSIFTRSCGAAENLDVVVVGATPGGIATAVTAARFGHDVALVEYHRHVGGMTASGLGKSDIHTRSAVAGLFTEFTDRVYRHYVNQYGEDSENVKLCRDGYYYEPHVAERVFRDILSEQPRIQLFLGNRLQEAMRTGNRLVGIRTIDRSTGEQTELRGRVFIDATYEGDLAAFAGARYRLGRESRAEFNESHAGVIYMDHRNRTLLPGSSGLGDKRVPAYTFRLCLSTDPANSVSVDKPDDYDRSRYVNYFADLELKRIPSAVVALSIAPIPNQKTDVNMKPWPLGFPFAGENYDYPEADWEEREKITKHLRDITLGLVYFLQNDPQLSEKDRARANQYGLSKDEFTDNANFPWQLYVREARRVVGEYTISEHDLVLAPGSQRAPVHSDAIAAAAFPIDSFPTQKREPGRTKALEGYLFMMRNITRPYQIPYRAIVPETVDGLLVPVALSATHVAFSAIRMEPTWMAIGQAAGTAAHLSLTQGVKLRDLRVATLQRLLLENGQVIEHFVDRKTTGRYGAAIQFLGTKGFFNDYAARPFEPISRAEAAHWLSLVLKVTGKDIHVGSKTRLRWRDFSPGDKQFASAAGLSLGGVIDPAVISARFRPDDTLTVDEFSEWFERMTRYLQAGSGSPLGGQTAIVDIRSHAIGIEQWRTDPGERLDPNRAVKRAEICQALFLLLQQFGY